MREIVAAEFFSTDSLFFDVADEDDEGGAYPVSLPSGWEMRPGRHWIGCRPPRQPRMPEQGWKIHVSATLTSAPDILRATVRHLVQRHVSFKFIRSESVLRRRSAKDGDRSASGKFITVYPRSDEQTEELLHGLDELVGGRPGPYILSDLRWKDGPLYVRYGGFVRMWGRDSQGVLVPSLKDESGRLVPDERRPVFRPPSWVRIPDFLEEAVEARNAATLRDFPYEIRQAVGYSNGGGLYRATEPSSGRPVLLREARPFAGVDAAWGDAVTRLKREHWALETLQGLPCVPEVFGCHKGAEHHYLARAYVEGKTLAVMMARRHPYATGDRSPDAYRSYARWALDVLERIEDALRAIHSRGVVFGDLHPRNVLLTEDGDVRFIDFETATAVHERRPQTLGALGYKAPEHLVGPDIDRYAMAVLRLAVFLPAPQAIPWGAGKARQLVEEMTSEFALPAEFADSILTWLSPRNIRSAVDHARDWPAQPERSPVMDDIVRSVLAVATPHRRDRLYPGDPTQFTSPGGGLSFGVGAAGTLWALAHLGHDVPGAHVRWFLDRVRASDDGDGIGSGFVTGLAGIAHTLGRLGEHERAGRVLERALAGLQGDGASHSFSTGAAGFGLAALAHHRATGEARWLDVCGDLAAAMDGTTAAADRPGLLNGRTGPALFLLHLHRVTGDPAYAARAGEELERDLSSTATDRLGLGLDGIGGMALVLDAAVRAGADQLRKHQVALVSQLEKIPTGFGLWSGLTGVIVARAEQGLTNDPHLRCLGWHAITADGDAIHFIGNRRFRLSTDLATGSIGAVLALASARDGVAHFPFLGEDLR